MIVANVWGWSQYSLHTLNIHIQHFTDDTNLYTCSGEALPTADVIKLKHVLLQHQLKVISGENEEDLQLINVRRKYIFEDAMRAFTKSSFTVSKMLKVRFISEQAQDEGGPRREFFCQLMKEALQQPTLFIGWPDHVIPVHNITAVSENKFYVIGKMIATSIITASLVFFFSHRRLHDIRCYKVKALY